MCNKLAKILKRVHNFVMAKAAKPPPTALSREIAAILRARIARLGVTQGAVAEAADVSPAQLSDMINSKKHMDVEQLDRICFSLGLKLSAVTKEAEEATASRHAESGATAVPVKR